MSMEESEMREQETRNLGVFEPRLVAELLNGEYQFRIPSYQRGYRWGKREVEDLLDDLYTFVTKDAGSVYFLQPIVVLRTPKGEWVVLDGQQRLTTILLILKRFALHLPEKDRVDFCKKQYKIAYDTRHKSGDKSELDFDNPDAKANIDAFHVFNAKRVIEDWVQKKINDGKESALSKMVKSLFDIDSGRKVCFIWYALDGNYAVKESIGLFNRLNKGKIGLTGAELIKALFVLENKKSGMDAVNRFAFEWDNIVRRLQDDSFWYFISPSDDMRTRMDSLFDFVTNCSAGDEAYRTFQNAYDSFAGSGQADVIFEFDGVKYTEFVSLWRVVTQRFDDLVRWYEDPTAYNYIGWLRRNGFSLCQVKKIWDSAKSEQGCPVVRNEDHYRKLRDSIKGAIRVPNVGTGKLEPLSQDTLASLTYRENYDLLKRILLLFNVETERVAGKRFRFDCLSKEKGWDLEHVDSQQDNALKKNDEQIEWIGFVLQVLSWMDQTESVKSLIECGKKLLQVLKVQGRDEGDQFGKYYSRIFQFLVPASADEVDLNDGKDGVSNLALLDCGTNRSYKNAPFPYKRFRIIERDKKGWFVPECTKDLFLKYYSDTGKDASQIDKFRWGDNDRKKYFDAICSRLSAFIEGGM